MNIGPNCHFLSILRYFFRFTVTWRASYPGLSKRSTDAAKVIVDESKVDCKVNLALYVGGCKERE